MISNKAATSSAGYDFGETPLLKATLYKKYSQRVGTVEMLPDSGASVNLMSLAIAKRFHLAYDKMEAGSFDVQDAQGQQLEIVGKADIRLKIDGINKYRQMEVLLTDNLEDQRIILGWGQLVAWGIVSSDFPSLNDYTVETRDV